MAPQLNTTRARQGNTGKPILWVLGISLVLGVAVLFGAWAMKSDDLATTEVNNRPASAAATSDAPEPTPRQNTDTPPPARPPA